MLPEVGGLELVVVALVALIVVGPKDLPLLLRKLGQFVAKMRGMASEFRASFDEMARQSELDELRKEVEALRNTRVGPQITGIAQDIEAELGDLNHEMNLNPHPMTDSTGMPASYWTGDTPAEPEAAPKPKRARAIRKAAEPDVIDASAAEPAENPRKAKAVKAVAAPEPPPAKTAKPKAPAAKAATRKAPAKERAG